MRYEVFPPYIVSRILAPMMIRRVEGSITYDRMPMNWISVAHIEQSIFRS